MKNSKQLRLNDCLKAKLDKHRPLAAKIVSNQHKHLVLQRVFDLPSRQRIMEKCQ